MDKETGDLIDDTHRIAMAGRVVAENRESQDVAVFSGRVSGKGVGVSKCAGLGGHTARFGKQTRTESTVATGDGEGIVKGSGRIRPGDGDKQARSRFR